MRTSWRSWFWNIVLMIVMLFMSSIFTSVAFSQSNVAAVIGFGLSAAIFWIGTIRSLVISVSVRQDGIVMRGFTRTITIPWSEVEEIGGVAAAPGAAAMAGATTPVVVRRRPNGKREHIGLEPLSSYGLFRARSTTAERAIVDLNRHLERWRNEHEGSSENDRIGN